MRRNNSYRGVDQVEHCGEGKYVFTGALDTHYQSSKCTETSFRIFNGQFFPCEEFREANKPFKFIHMEPMDNEITRVYLTDYGIS